MYKLSSNAVVPDDDLFLRSKHVAFYIIKLVVLDIKVFSVILNTQ